MPTSKIKFLTQPLMMLKKKIILQNQFIMKLLRKSMKIGNKVWLCKDFNPNKRDITVKKKDKGKLRRKQKQKLKG